MQTNININIYMTNRLWVTGKVSVFFSFSKTKGLDVSDHSVGDVFCFHHRENSSLPIQPDAIGY